MFRKIIVLLLLSCVPVFAADTPASADSIKEVLRVTNVQALLDRMWPQIDAMMTNAMQQSLQGRTLTPQQQQALTDLKAKLIASMKQQLSWDQMEPMYIEIYQKSFTQSELDGMLAFYKSPAGEAVIKKMPVVMQQTMLALQQRMMPMLQQMHATVQQSVAQLTAPTAPKSK